MYLGMPFLLAPSLIANSDPTKLLSDIVAKGRKPGAGGKGTSGPAQIDPADAASVLSSALAQLREIPRALPTSKALFRRYAYVEASEHNDAEDKKQS